jgi:polyisoprenyl-teichoic acid--peptidoglycan teichoic acid transferase
VSDLLAGKRLYYREPTGFQWWWLIWVAAGVVFFICGAALGVISNGSSTWLGGLMAPPFGGAERVSVLLVGTDNSKGKGLADTIMVAMVSPRTDDISMLSIPRDSRVEIPGAGLTRINASHSTGGLPLTIQTVQELLGVNIDYYIEVNVPGLVKLVDAIGGVDLDVEKRMHYTDRSQKLYIDLQTGMQHLDGTQAMGYVRFRHDAIGDFGRVERQRKFMRAVVKKLFSPEHMATLPKVAQLLTDGKTVNTNLTLRDIMALKRVMENVDPDAIRSATLPATPVSVGGADMLDLDPAQVRDTVDRVLLHQGISVEVLNGTGREGLAAQAAEMLEQQGCQITNIGNAKRTSDTTLVVDHRTQARRAERVAGWLGMGAVAVAPDSENPADVTVVLGKDILTAGQASP